MQAWVEGTTGGIPFAAGTDCTICYENPIDAVLYMCGHMCMCYECALQQWRGKGGGHCPLCRAVIKDVIRTYKSWFYSEQDCKSVSREEKNVRTHGEGFLLQISEYVLPSCPEHSMMLTTCRMTNGKRLDSHRIVVRSFCTQ